MSQTHFILLSRQRSTAVNLQRALAEHPQIYCSQTAFDGPVPSPARVYVRGILQGHSDKLALGFVLHYEQLRRHTELIYALAGSSNIRVIGIHDYRAWPRESALAEHRLLRRNPWLYLTYADLVDRMPHVLAACYGFLGIPTQEMIENRDRTAMEFAASGSGTFKP